MFEERRHWPTPVVWSVLAASLLLSVALDRAVLEWVRTWNQAVWARIWAETAYLAGLGWVQVAVVALVSLAAWRLGRSWGQAVALASLGSLAASGIITQVIKHLVGRPRPRMGLPPLDLAGPTWDSGFHSFPSGHTATSFALAAMLAVKFPRGGPFFFLAAGLVALGRVVGTAHYLSDTIGGAVLGLAVGIPLGWKIRNK